MRCGKHPARDYSVSVVLRILRRLRRRLGSLDRGEHATEEGQLVENLDATAAAVKHQSDSSGR